MGTLASRAFSPVLGLARGEASLPKDTWKAMDHAAWHAANAVLEEHLYFAFGDTSGWGWMSGNAQSFFLRTAACNWRRRTSWAQEHQLPALVGAWSLATTDCLAWLHGFGQKPSFSECLRPMSADLWQVPPRKAA